MLIKNLTIALIIFLFVNSYLCAQTVTDIDGNSYVTVTIGDQTWMASNLRATKYADGTPIPKVTDNAAWGALEDDNSYANAAYCWYNNDSVAYAEKYGALYTWQAAMGFREGSSNPIDSIIQGACPSGWHLPSEQEWDDLETYLTNNGYSGREGIAIRSTTDWAEDYNGTDPFGFNAYPVDGRFSGTGRGEGNFDGYGYNAFFWTSTEKSATTVETKFTRYHDYFLSGATSSKSSGTCVRCIKDAEETSKVDNNQLMGDVLIYPNPANDMITISCPQFIEAEVFSVSGNSLQTSVVPEINIQLLKPGVYVVKVKSEQGTYTSKFIKQ